MKVVKVHIRRGKLGEDMMIYPKRYNAEEVDRNGIGPTNVNGIGAYSGLIGRGGREDWCIIILEDELAKQYARDPDMSIISAEQADALMEQWRIDNGLSETVIRNPDAVIISLLKRIADVPQEKEDLLSLDPESPTPGVNKRLRKVADIVAAAGAKLS